MTTEERLQASCDRWTPRRIGDYYCSPACGGMCTYNKYTIAVNNANTLCKKLGNGFTPKVWENLGWFWSVTNGPITVRQSYDNTYMATIDVSCLGTIETTDSDPILAVTAAIDKARAIAHYILRYC